MSHKVEILSVGTELLLGSIANTDAQMLRLEVSESMEREGKRVFGYDVPLIYKRTN